MADIVTLVAMGGKATARTDEDEPCALHLRNLLEGRPGNAEAIRALILAGAEAEHFHDPAQPHFQPGDLDIAPDIDRYDFAIRIDVDNGRPGARIERG